MNHPAKYDQHLGVQYKYWSTEDSGKFTGAYSFQVHTSEDTIDFFWTSDIVMSKEEAEDLAKKYAIQKIDLIKSS